MIENLITRHRIFGTAGHIDHGKTALVKALTGYDADTLAEEKKRGITIELGFVFLDEDSPDRQIMFIDVPGHEKLVKTMVAGASNIDAVLFVIAADEGINAQTREHFDILRILGIKRGVIALTKSDLTDNELLNLRKEEIRRFISGSPLTDAPILPVSAVTGKGIEALKDTLKSIASAVDDRPDSGIFRMPVDRIFTMKGFGTVIAGTILSGSIKTGDNLIIYPEEIPAKVRGIQVHHLRTESSIIGRRTAVNLLNIDKDILHRGQVAARPGALIPTYRLDADLHLLESASKDLSHRDRIRIHIGTAEIIARVVLLDRPSLTPGQSAPVQFVLESPTISLPGDRYVIRTFSPLLTIGGGIILDASPSRHKRFDDKTMSGLKKMTGDIGDAAEQVIRNSGFEALSIGEAALRLGEDEESVGKALQSLCREDRIHAVGKGTVLKYIHGETVDMLGRRALNSIHTYLKKNPARTFMPLTELRSAFLQWSDKQVFPAILQHLEQEIDADHSSQKVSLKGYRIALDPREQALSDKILDILNQTKLQTPTPEIIRGQLNIPSDKFAKIINYLKESGSLVRLSDKVVYPKEILADIQSKVRIVLKNKGKITISDLRDTLGLSRKYGQAILEYFDETGLTKRAGDAHILAD
jgi:selenocysteine-specific elongation factor